jgi:hypothetical protein
MARQKKRESSTHWYVLLAITGTLMFMGGLMGINGELNQIQGALGYFIGIILLFVAHAYRCLRDQAQETTEWFRKALIDATGEPNAENTDDKGGIH